MYHGSLPEPGRQTPAPIPVRHPTRRTLLRCAGVFVLGAVAGGSAARWFAAGGRGGNGGDEGGTEGGSAPLGGAAPRRGSLEWARQLQHATDAELIAAAGDLEFVRASHPDQGDLLVPLFVRILAAAEFIEGPDADIAASVAVRSIARLGRPQFALECSTPLEAREDLPATARQRERILEKLRRQLASDALDALESREDGR